MPFHYSDTKNLESSRNFILIRKIYINKGDFIDAMSQTILESEFHIINNTGRWMTEIYDNDFTPLKQVVETLVKATRCTFEEANTEAWEAQTFGKAAVYFGSFEECSSVASALEIIFVKTCVRKEWGD